MKKTREEYNAYMADYMLKRYHRRRSEAIEKLGGQCIDCNSKDDLEFDHEDRTSKSFDIAKAFSSMANDRLAREIEKCVLRCRYCHETKSIHEKGLQRWRHGTLSGYRHCKCDLCRKANNEYHKNYKRASRSTVV